ncbi:MAG TPA: exodeoxyribonuclease VII large subunit [Nevskiaceae bacterium]|nr:exodeoxyribonuclease VII large subunit [Nevskiaceae bacterium]
MPKSIASAAPQAFTVYALTQAIKGALETGFPVVWVEGELSNFSCPASGHWYFSLKDEHAQLRCVMFRGNNLRVRPRPTDGDQLLVRGRISLYDRRGDLQLICDHMQPAGLGALQREFERLKQRLEAEGLFDAAKRRPIPERPRHIGVISSGTGAALQDILNTLQRRWPLATVDLWPTPVQGAAAAPAIAAALRGLPRHAPVDVILLARGGGSLEDLWAFNEEVVARAVRACSVPVITGVGHETDFTIADFAADLRAPTPTAAAERATPDTGELLSTVARLRAALNGRQTARLGNLLAATDVLAQRLQRQHPRRRLQNDAQRIDEQELRLARQFGQRLQRQGSAVDSALQRLSRQHPRRVLATHRQRLDLALTRLAPGAQRILAIARQHLQSQESALIPTRLLARLERDMTQQRALQQRLAACCALQLVQRQARAVRAGQLLEALGPKAVLARGYAMVTDAGEHVVRDAAAVAVGQTVTVQLHRGRLDVAVRSKTPAKGSNAV